MANAFKHAFPDKHNADEISVRVGSEVYMSLNATINHKLTLIVSDNGIGLPTNLNIKNTSAIGLPLVTTLVKQLEGTMTIENTAGTSIKITFTEFR
ncbi:MAG: hypothetical protein F6K19_25880 [Cyanothece sp. SIO1E1]|nr:hypothetical protein [Cyanothece sp. SIO1E1]